MPLIVTDVLPVVGPDAGVTPVTVGGARYVYPASSVARSPFVLASTTATVPASWAGTRAVTSVALRPATSVQAWPPTVTRGSGSKPVPAIVIVVLPVTGPNAGVTVVIVGGVTKANPPASVPRPPSGVVTVTSAAPAAWAGVLAEIRPGLHTVTSVAAVAPNVSAASGAKCSPPTDTTVPPAVEPTVGAMSNTTGGSANT